MLHASGVCVYGCFTTKYMAREIINVGATPNDGLGDPIRTAFTKTNTNFSELFA